jgi:phosphohistidine phosphatase
MILYIVRHAWAGEFGDPRYPDDSQRPLTDEGRKRFRAWLKELDNAKISPQLILTSPFVRCRQTAELVHDWLGKKMKSPPDLHNLTALRSGAADIDDVLSGSHEFQADGDQMWVGHMPDVAMFTAALIGDARAGIHFGKGAIAALQFDKQPAVGMGELLWLASPKIADV